MGREPRGAGERLARRFCRRSGSRARTSSVQPPSGRFLSHPSSGSVMHIALIEQAIELLEKARRGPPVRAAACRGSTSAARQLRPCSSVIRLRDRQPVAQGGGRGGDIQAHRHFERSREGFGHYRSGHGTVGGAHRRCAARRHLPRAGRRDQLLPRSLAPAQRRARRSCPRREFPCSKGESSQEEARGRATPGPLRSSACSSFGSLTHGRARHDAHPPRPPASRRRSDSEAAEAEATRLARHARARSGARGAEPYERYLADAYAPFYLAGNGKAHHDGPSWSCW